MKLGTEFLFTGQPFSSSQSSAMLFGMTGELTSGAGKLFVNCRAVLVSMRLSLSIFFKREDSLGDLHETLGSQRAAGHAAATYGNPRAALLSALYYEQSRVSI